MYVHLVTAVIVYILTFSFMDVPVFQTGITTCSYLTVCKGYPKSEPVLAENIFFICLIFEQYFVRTLEIDNGQFNTMFGYEVNGQAGK